MSEPEHRPIKEQLGLSSDGVYGGSMSAYEFYQAEFEVDPNFAFDNDEVPYTKLQTEHGDIVAHWYNTEVIKYGADWSHMNHIHIDATDQEVANHVYFFQNTHTQEGEEEKWVNIANALLKKDYTLSAPPEKPNSHIFAQYWTHIRGGETIEQIIEKCLEDGAE